jgi:SAM-dependent methyltransferase
MSAPSVDTVRAYYDRNTPRFERLGQGGASIHRAVWGEGVSTRAEAFRFVDRCILRAAERRGPPPARALDLGCGLGESLTFLARAIPGLSGTGVTLSGVQATRARERAGDSKLEERLRFVEADFHELPGDLGTFDLAFAIESFVHANDPRAFFRNAARHLKAGGTLAICDDFQARPARDRKEATLIERIRHGWLAVSLLSPDAVSDVARSEGFRLLEDRDLNGGLVLRRPRDRLISLWLALTAPLRMTGHYQRSLRGGDALQQALVRRLVEYRLLEFERS